jgi:uncharacterized protein YbjT (DUF2867 family)
MRLLVVGATGGLGRDVVAGALARGHHTAALVRDPRRAALPDGVVVIEGDVLAPESLTTALEGSEAVICVLGTPSPRRPSTLLQAGTRNLVDAVRRSEVRRLVCVTLLGIGGSRGNASLLYREVLLRVLAPMVPDKQAQEQAVRHSGLDWVLVRPPRFVGGRPRSNLRVIGEGQPGRLSRVVRADLARFLVDCVSDDRWVGQAIAVGS